MKHTAKAVETMARLEQFLRGRFSDAVQVLPREYTSSRGFYVNPPGMIIEVTEEALQDAERVESILGTIDEKGGFSPPPRLPERYAIDSSGFKIITRS